MIFRSFFVSTGLFLSLVSGVCTAQAGDIWLCTDDHGNRTFTNLGDTKRCKKLDVQPIMTIPATKVPKTAASNTTPSEFPKVDPSTQKSRDATRKQLLE